MIIRTECLYAAHNPFLSYLYFDLLVGFDYSTGEEVDS